MAQARTGVNYGVFGRTDSPQGIGVYGAAHISMVDADGVALASIQALRQRVAEQQGEISELRAQVAGLLARQAR